MTNESPEIVSSLPSRPLTVQEGRAFEEQESESAYVRPESTLLLNDREAVVALAVVNRDAGSLFLVGYSPDAEAWTIVDRWSEAELEKDAFYQRLDEWEAETFAGRPEFESG